MSTTQKQIEDLAAPSVGVRSPFRFLIDTYKLCLKGLATLLRISPSKLNEITRASLLTLSSMSLFLIALSNDWMILLIIGLCYFLLGLVVLILLLTDSEN